MSVVLEEKGRILDEMTSRLKCGPFRGAKQSGFPGLEAGNFRIVDVNTNGRDSLGVKAITTEGRTLYACYKLELVGVEDLSHTHQHILGDSCEN